MKQPPEIIYTGLRRVVGNPTDYSNNKQSDGFNKSYDLKIPIAETDQKKVHKILDGIDNDHPHQALNDNFNRMNIKSPINEQARYQA